MARYGPSTKGKPSLDSPILSKVGFRIIVGQQDGKLTIQIRQSKPKLQRWKMAEIFIYDDHGDLVFHRPADDS